MLQSELRTKGGLIVQVFPKGLQVLMMSIMELSQLFVMLMPLLKTTVGFECWTRPSGDVRLIELHGLCVQGGLVVQLLPQLYEILAFRVVCLPDLVVMQLVLFHASVTSECWGMSFCDMGFLFGCGCCFWGK